MVAARYGYAQLS